MKSYHFDVGNSNVGHIGLSARVIAKSKAEALEKLKAALPEMFGVTRDEDDVVYIHVYLNPDAFTVKDIDEFDEVPVAD